MHKQNKKLGKGLTSLFGEEVSQFSNEDGIINVRIEEIEPNPDQPRKFFKEDKLTELIASVQSKGILSPIIVRKLPTGKYQIIAGERRFRAAKEINLPKVPILIKNTNKEEQLELALIENIQRADLTPIEEALACEALLEAHNYTQEVLAKTLGKSRSYITNLLRILTLPEEVRGYINEGLLTMGHAKVMVGKENILELAHKVIKEQLSVRQTEQLLLEGKKKPKNKQILNSEDLMSLENIMSEKLKFNIKIRAKNNHSGEVLLKFKDFQELDKILQFLNNIK